MKTFVVQHKIIGSIACVKGVCAETALADNGMTANQWNVLAVL